MNLISSRQSLKWGTFHVCLLAVLLFDISNQQPFALSKWYYVECFIAVLVSLSVAYYFGKYFYLLFTVQPLHGTVQQRDLLQFRDGGECLLMIKLTTIVLSDENELQV